jgi:hypothetical protein
LRRGERLTGLRRLRRYRRYRASGLRLLLLCRCRLRRYRRYRTGGLWLLSRCRLRRYRRYRTGGLWLLSRYRLCRYRLCRYRRRRYRRYRTGGLRLRRGRTLGLRRLDTGLRRPRLRIGKRVVWPRGFGLFCPRRSGLPRRRSRRGGCAGGRCLLGRRLRGCAGGRCLLGRRLRGCLGGRARSGRLRGLLACGAGKVRLRAAWQHFNKNLGGARIEHLQPFGGGS